MFLHHSCSELLRKNYVSSGQHIALFQMCVVSQSKNRQNNEQFREIICIFNVFAVLSSFTVLCAVMLINNN